MPPKVSPGILWNLSFSTATVNSSSSKTGVVTKAQTWTCWSEAGVLSKQLWSKAGMRVSPSEGCTSICTQISLQPGEEAVLTNLIWGLGGQKGSSAHPSAQIFYCPHLRLFWKMPFEIPRHRPLWMKFLSCLGDTAGTQKPCLRILLQRAECRDKDGWTWTCSRPGSLLQHHQVLQEPQIMCMDLLPRPPERKTTLWDGGGWEVLREEEPSSCSHLLWEHQGMRRHHWETYLEHIHDNWNNKCGKVFQLIFETSVWCCEERGVSVMWKSFPFPQKNWKTARWEAALKNRRCKWETKKGWTGLKAQVLVPYACVGSGVTVTYPGRFLEWPRNPFERIFKTFFTQAMRNKA